MKEKLILNYTFKKYHSLNECFSEHWSERNKVKKDIENEVYYLVLNMIKQHEIDKEDKNKYKYKFYFEYTFKNENADTDNFGFMKKSIMDAIKKTDLIIDDSFKFCETYDKGYKCSKTSDNNIKVYFTRTKRKEPIKEEKAPQKQIQWGYPNRK